MPRNGWEHYLSISPEHNREGVNFPQIILQLRNQRLLLPARLYCIVELLEYRLVPP